jgi:hypothetical protein
MTISRHGKVDGWIEKLYAGNQLTEQEVSDSVVIDLFLFFSLISNIMRMFVHL